LPSPSAPASFKRWLGAETSSFFFSVPEANPVGLQHLTTRKSGTEADVIVGIRPRIIDVEREHARRSTIIEVAAPKRI
jgi:hypothetical protein